MAQASCVVTSSHALFRLGKLLAAVLFRIKSPNVQLAEKTLHLVVALKKVGCLCVTERGVARSADGGCSTKREVFPLLFASLRAFER